MLIQLPPRNVDEEIQEEVIKILKDRFDISEDNGKLAIYLSEGSVNRENIEIKDSPVEVMIFKEAIALGWDCPRAHILVQLRDWRSITFSMQTVGRITRMPELKHYEKIVPCGIKDKKVTNLNKIKKQNYKNISSLLEKNLINYLKI